MVTFGEADHTQALGVDSGVSRPKCRRIARDITEGSKTSVRFEVQFSITLLECNIF